MVGRLVVTAIALVSSALATGCDSSSGLPADGNRTDGGRWASHCPIPSDAPGAPLGLTADALTARYGPAAAAERFVLGHAVDPVRMSVRNALATPSDLRREVREMVWRERGCELRVWLAERGGRWVAVQTMRAPDGGEH